MSDRLRKILITGSSGFLGAILVESFFKEPWADQDHTQILGLYNKYNDLPTKWPNQQPKVDVSFVTGRVDIRDVKALTDIVTDFSPDIVIHCAALRDLEYCESYPAKAGSVNVVGTENMVSLCNKLGCKLVYISTDMVYDGTATLYNETSGLHPVNEYGKSKAAGEELVRNGLHTDSWTIIRISRLYGVHPLGREPDLARTILERTGNNQEVVLPTDEYRNVTYAPWAAKAIIALSKHNAFGVFHVCGDLPISKYDFGIMIAKQFGSSTERIKPVSSEHYQMSNASHGPAVTRPKRVMLNNTKLRTIIGSKSMMPTIADTLKMFKMDLAEYKVKRKNLKCKM